MTRTETTKIDAFVSAIAAEYGEQLASEVLAKMRAYGLIWPGNVDWGEVVAAARARKIVGAWVRGSRVVCDRCHNIGPIAIGWEDPVDKAEAKGWAVATRRGEIIRAVCPACRKDTCPA